ncbi:MAG: hypothetical protein WC284_07805 [Candidimonas sp.]
MIEFLKTLNSVIDIPLAITLVGMSFAVIAGLVKWFKESESSKKIVALENKIDSLQKQNEEIKEDIDRLDRKNEKIMELMIKYLSD